MVGIVIFVDGQIYEVQVWDVLEVDCQFNIEVEMLDCLDFCLGYIVGFSVVLINNSFEVVFIDEMEFNVIFWFWLFGDGINSIVLNLVYVFLIVGIYMVCLMVMDNSIGCLDMYCLEVEVNSMFCNIDFVLFFNGLFVILVDVM